MSNSKSRVNFFFLNSNSGLRNRKELKSFLVSLFKREQIQLETINYIFTDDKKLLEINKRYLNHSFFTDIITFALSKKDQPVSAEVYISIERVKENAHFHQTTLKQELHRVIFHGALHLCGYNDKTKQQMIQMRKTEDYYLAKYFG